MSEDLVPLKRRLKDGWPANPTGHDGGDWRVSVGRAHPDITTLASLHQVERVLWYQHLRLQKCAKEFFALEKQFDELKKDLAEKEKALIDLAERYARDTAELQRQLKGEEDGQGGQERRDGDPDASAHHSRDG